jgi:hypothetical protein
MAWLGVFFIKPSNFTVLLVDSPGVSGASFQERLLALSDKNLLISRFDDSQSSRVAAR